MVKDAFAWMDTQESTASAKPLEPQPTTPDPTVPSLAPPILFLPTESAFARPDSPESMASVFKPADAEPTATITD